MKSPWVYLAGTAIGFSLSVWSGNHAETSAPPARFSRFHVALSPEGSFFPPFSMLENLALGGWSPGRTVVIIAGNSILNGYGQSEETLWSRKLQEILGDRYSVVNLSFRGALPTEGGALVAEALIKRGIPVVLVTNGSPGTVGRPAGDTYGYLYWNASYRGKLLDQPARSADITAWESTLRGRSREKEEEASRGALLDSRLHFQALWHQIALKGMSTIWNNRDPARFWMPRDSIEDDGVDFPPLSQNIPADPGPETDVVRGFSVNLAKPDAAAGWKLDRAPQRVFDDLVEHMVPLGLMPRMIVLLTQNAPFYRGRLTPAELARDKTVFAGYASRWKWHGIAAYEVGSDFADADYVDRSHLSASGGARLARLTADYVLALDAK